MIPSTLSSLPPPIILLVYPGQAEIYKVKRSEHTPINGTAKHQKASLKKRVLVLYGSETGTAEGYAFDTAARLCSFACHVRGGMQLLSTFRSHECN